jgi:hypothetical protein
MLIIDKISMQKQGNCRRVTHRKHRKGKKSIRDTSMMGGNQNNGFPQPPTNMLNIAAARQIAMQAAIMPEVPRNMLNIPAAQAQATFIQKNRKTRKNKRKF